MVRVNGKVPNRTVVVDSDCQQQQSYLGLRSPQPTFEMTPGFKPFTVRN